MAKIKVELSHAIIDGQPVTFVAPCDCTAITGLKVYYPGGSKEFTFKDANGNDLTGLGNLFSSGAYVKAILNVNSGNAYLQNADTNAYLEAGIIKTYTHSNGNLVGSGVNGKFKATVSGTISSIKVNGTICSVKCGEDTSMDLVEGCWYTFIRDGNVINFSSGGAGSGGLELRIVGGTTRPAKPTQNMIWAVTEHEITSYVLSATQPDAPVEGMVWLIIGDSGTTEVCSPVGGNWITVYPLSAKQYVSGAWAGVTAKSYQNGEWAGWYGVPVEYKRVAYLEATGTQYINTEVVHVADTKIEAEVYAYSAYVRGYEAFFGARNGDYTKNAFAVFKRFASKNQIGYNRSGVETVGSGFVYDEKVKLVVSGQTASYYKDDTLLGSVVTTGTADNGFCSMLLFNINSSKNASGVDIAGNNDNGSKMRLYSFKMWNGGTLVRDFIPCYRISDNVAGLYDFINGKFYQNSGTGSFVVGEDV